MTDHDGIRATLLQFLKDDTVADVDKLSDDTGLRGGLGLGLDSVDFVGIIMRIEGHYRIRLTHDELESANTVGDLVALIRDKTAGITTAAA